MNDNDILRGSEYGENQYNDLNLMEIWETIWSHQIIIIVFMLVAVSLTFIKATYFTDDTYTANGILYISNRKEADAKYETSIQKTDIDSSRTLSTTCIEILKTRAFLSQISKETYDIYSWQKIRKMTTFSSIAETELLSVSVTATSANEAYNIADKIVREAPSKLQSVFKNGEIEIVDKVVYPEQPDDNGMAKKMIVSILAGAALGIVFVFIRKFFDRKVHKSEELSKRYNISILGELE